MSKSIKNPLSWMSQDIQAADTQKYGNGVYAKKKIKADSLIAIFGGHIMSREEEERLPKSIRDSAIQIDRDFVIGANKVDEIGAADYFNHSCEPNAGIKGQISLYAMRDIQKGEEILFDYGTVLFRMKGSPKYVLACGCNANTCRKKITQEDWKLERVQKYGKYLPYYIQEEIKKLKTS